MVKTETIIAVESVPKSSEFYQKLLGCRGEHGGDSFEILTSGTNVVLCLHKWGEPDHPSMTRPIKENGNGLILFFRVENLNEIFENAKTLEAHIEKEIHYNEYSLKHQFALRDLDGYYLIVSE